MQGNCQGVRERKRKTNHPLALKNTKRIKDLDGIFTSN